LPLADLPATATNSDCTGVFDDISLFTRALVTVGVNVAEVTVKVVIDVVVEYAEELRTTPFVATVVAVVVGADDSGTVAHNDGM
jgi:hypothetical protein